MNKNPETQLDTPYLRLAQSLPTLLDRIRLGLRNDASQHIDRQLELARLERCTYDPEANAAYLYIYIAWPDSGRPHNVARTLSFDGYAINLDLDAAGRLMGIELLDQPALFAELENAGLIRTQ